MRRADALALVTLAACGRVAFDPVHDDAGRDTPPAGASFLVAGSYFSAQGEISVYRIDAQTGSLVATSQGAVTSVDHAEYPAATPDGRFVYFPHESMTQSLVSGFAIATDGFLTPIPGSPFPGPGVFGQIAVMHPSGKFVFVSGQGGIQCYVIDPATGAIAKSQPAAIVPMGFQMAIDPQGQYLFSAAYDSGLVYGFAIGADCALTSTGPATAVVGTGLHGIAFDRQGLFLVVLATSNASINVYAIDRATGALALAQSPYTGTGYWVTFDPSGTHMLVAALDAGLREFAFDRSTGALTVAAGSPFRNGAGRYWVAAYDPTGTYAYTSSETDLELDPFRVAGTGLLPLPTVPATSLAFGMTIVTPQ